MAVCGVGGFGAGGCACGCASRPAENEENFTFIIGKVKDCSRIAKHFVLEKMSLFENSMRAGGGLSLSLRQSQTCSSYLGDQVKLQGFKY